MRVRHRGTAALTSAVLIAAAFTAAQRAEKPQRADGFPPARGAGQGRPAEPVQERDTAPLAGSVGRGDRAGCRMRVTGSRAVADCHNPDPVTDRVRLHVECARWWDIDADSAPVDVPPAGYARLTERCWKEVASVWVSHEPVHRTPAAHAPPASSGAWTATGRWAARAPAYVWPPQPPSTRLTPLAGPLAAVGPLPVPQVRHTATRPLPVPHTLLAPLPVPVPLVPVAPGVVTSVPGRIADGS